MGDRDQRIQLDHFLTVEGLSNEQVFSLIHRAQQFKNGHQVRLSRNRRFVANLFFENSTRTHHSFGIAEKKMGLEVIEFNAATSSIKKGETLYDTVLTLAALGVEACVIRHEQEGFYKELIHNPTLNCAVINAGDGSGQHPSQCMLDLMTIYEEFGHFAGLNIGIVGDISHSRVAKSNMQMLSRLGAQLFFSGPEEWFEDEFKSFGKFKPLDELVNEMDVLLLLRVQYERHGKKVSFSKEDYHAKYGLTAERASRMLEHAIIMHPAPVNRGFELAEELIEGERSRIVSQMTNGVFMRMAILEAIFEGRG